MLSRVGSTGLSTSGIVEGFGFVSVGPAYAAFAAGFHSFRDLVECTVNDMGLFDKLRLVQRNGGKRLGVEESILYVLDW